MALVHSRAARRVYSSASGRPALALNLAVFAGGCLGALARFGLLEALPVRPGAWPWATLIANVAGCALLGAVSARLLRGERPSRHRGPLLGAGLCGALTTFATVQVEAVLLIEGGHVATGVSYLFSTVISGLLAAHLAGRLAAPRGTGAR
ncbi:MAG: CrcB family protein [Miltoncostaeaceae bacterium]